MKSSKARAFFNDTTLLLLLGLVLFLLHMFTNHQYGFHQDEMVVLDNAYHLDWGFIEYPPVTPFLARVAIELFGLSLVGARIFSALVHSITMVLAGLMARELGAKRVTQVVAALVAAIAPVALVGGATVMYATFDYLWSVLIAYFTIRLLKTDDPRWWLGIGVGIGLGMMTKYNMVFFVAGLVGGVLLTRARRYLTSPWLWGGAAISLLIFLPNLIWQIQHDFISLEFLQSIHARDVAIGRAEGFLLEQFVFSSNPFVTPFWIAGLYYYIFHQDGKHYRLVGWLYVIPFVIYYVTQGRSYYLASAYPMLIAAGAVLWQDWLKALSVVKKRGLLGATWVVLAVGMVFGGVVSLPIPPVNSEPFRTVSEVHDLFTEQIGWPDMIKTVADIYADLPEEEKARVGILTGENDEAAALNVFGPAYGLPKAISGSDTFWLRGYGDPPPETVIVLGIDAVWVHMMFGQCEQAGTISNQYGIRNDLTDPPQIYVCREPRLTWPELWKRLKHFS